MPTQMNFGPKQPYKTAQAKATVKAPQTNYGTAASKREGGRNKSKTPVQYPGKQGVPGASTAKSHFGEKTGTGQNNGF